MIELDTLDLINRAYFETHKDLCTPACGGRITNEAPCPPEDAEICGSCKAIPAGADCELREDLLSGSPV